MQSNFRLNKLQLVALLALVFTAAFAIAQGIVTGSISGTVEDAQGAVINNAKVTAKEVATNREYTGQTSDAGILTLRGLPPGTYTLTVQAPNFRKYENKTVVVTVGADTGLGRIKMEIGSASETVTVEGTAPLVESTTQQISESFSARKAQDLPVGNTLDSLALFIPGIATAGDASFSNNNGAEISVNGQRARSNNYQIDGQNNNDNSVGGPSIFFGNQDAVSELQVVTNYSAEYGRNMGAVVNYITKGGTNSFHGSAYEIFNGSTFDSLGNESKNPILGWCMPGQNPGPNNVNCNPTFVPLVVDNRFGGTIGGPIKKDKLWFFGSAHFQRQRFGGSPSNSGSLVLPTANGLQSLQADFPGNDAVSALANIGPLAVKQGNPSFSNLQTIPVSATPGAVCPGDPSCQPVEFGTVNRFINSLFNDYEGTGRVDVKVTSKDDFFGRYIFQQNISTGSSGANGIAVGDFVDVPGRSQQIGLNWNRTWSLTFVNQLRFSFSRAGFGFEGGAFPNCTRANINDCPTNIQIGDGVTAPFGLSTNLPQGRIINVYQVQDNASKQVGKMTIKFGGDYTKQRSPNVFLPLTNGQFVYSDFNHYLAGTPDGGDSFAAGNPHLPFKENDVAFYVQDDWRIKDNLTLNLGMRWEFFQQAVNLLHDRTVAQQTGPNPFWDTTLPLSLTTIPHIPQDLNNFSPVVGFAWTPRIMRGLMGEDKTVIRGGFRIGYDPSFYNIFLNTATSSPVVNSNTGFAGPGVPASGLGTDVIVLLTPFNPSGVNPGTKKEVLVGPHFHNPYTEQWNFGIQRSFGQRVVAEVRYVGNHDVGNFMNFDANPALNGLLNIASSGVFCDPAAAPQCYFGPGFANSIPAGIAPCSDPTQIGFSRGFVDCTHTRVQERDNKAYSIYHSLQTELRMANYHGLTATFAYTFSKVLDNASEVYSNVAGGSTLAIPQNVFDLNKGEKGLSGIDFPHVFTLTLIYDLPFYKSQHGLMGKTLGGWQLNSTYRYNPGQPYTTIQERSPLVFGNGSPDLCDFRGALSTFYDACRPIISNPSAPVGSVGFCTDPTLPDCGITDYFSGLPTTMSAVRWIENGVTSAQFFGSPFRGAPRNSLRGQPISTSNLSMFKNTKLTERVTLQLRATAYNFMNVQFRGVPDPLMEDGGPGGSFQRTDFNGNGGATFAGNTIADGIGHRRLELGLKLIF